MHEMEFDTACLPRCAAGVNVVCTDLWTSPSNVRRLLGWQPTPWRHVAGQLAAQWAKRRGGLQVKVDYRVDNGSFKQNVADCVVAGSFMQGERALCVWLIGQL